MTATTTKDRRLTRPVPNELFLFPPCAKPSALVTRASDGYVAIMATRDRDSGPVISESGSVSIDRETLQADMRVGFTQVTSRLSRIDQVLEDIRADLGPTRDRSRDNSQAIHTLTAQIAQVSARLEDQGRFARGLLVTALFNAIAFVGTLLVVLLK